MTQEQTVTSIEIMQRIIKNGFIFVIFSGEDKQILLWKDGALLMALQHVLNKVSNEKVQVDCEFFRKRKEKQLREYAEDIARPDGCRQRR